jgi:hypothetical protein
MLVGHGDVLDHGQHGVLAGQARRDVAHGVQPGQRVERAAVVTGRQIRGTHHRQRRGQQHVLHGGTGGELVVGRRHDALGSRVLDELHQGLYVVRIDDPSGHAMILPGCETVLERATPRPRSNCTDYSQGQGIRSRQPKTIIFWARTTSSSPAREARRT